MERRKEAGMDVRDNEVMDLTWKETMGKTESRGKRKRKTRALPKARGGRRTRGREKGK